MKKRVADIVVDTLLELGVDTSFTVVGGGAMHLNNAFEINKKMKKIFCHHEQACAFAAEGYAKFSGKTAVVSVTSGPGAVNTLNGVYSAWVDHTPMIVVAGHPRYPTTVEASGLKLRCMGVQEFDIIPTVSNMTKYAVLLKDPKKVKYEIQKLYYTTMSGHRGPCWISIPLDIQAQMVETDELESFIPEEYKNIDSNEVKDIVKKIKEAKRPCILTGSALRTAGAMDLFYKMTELIDIPIVGGALLSDILPENYKNYYGLSGNIGPRAGNFILQNSDFILVLGNSMSARQTGFNVEEFAPDAYKVLINIEPDEAKKPGLNINKVITCDVKDFLTEFNKLLKIESISCDVKWKNYCTNAYEQLRLIDDPECNNSERVPAKYFWKKFRDYLPKDASVALGNSNGVIGIFQYGVKTKEQRVITNYNAGSMGYDLPEAVGMAIASGKEIYCVTGDGSIMMNLQELETIKYNKLPIKVIVFSNDGYGAIRQTCKNFFKGVYTGCDSSSGVDFPSFEKISDSFGFSYFHCKTVSELDTTIQKLINADGNALLEVEQLIDDPVIPKVVSKLNEDGTFKTPSLMEMSPLLSNEIVENIKSKLQ